MRSYFCRKCDLEFDLDMEEDLSQEDSDSMVFCPRCLITVAEVLPETPERILARERRLRNQERMEKRRSMRILAGGAALLLLTSAGFTFAYNSWFWMLVLSLIPGTVAGVCTKQITQDRSWRAGVLSLGVYAILLGLCVLIPWSCGRFFFLAPARNLLAGTVLAWICAVFEK